MSETAPPICHPTSYVPLSALATGALGDEALPVTDENPVPNRELPYRGARVLGLDSPVAAGRALLVDCLAGGQIEMVLADSSIVALTFAPGVTLLPFAATALNSAGTTATLSAWVLD
ncbi:MAG: hypothetical protein IE933_05065 [Sphingomonadales bacterium]|nr:hypothetical protein [Sphingomonadales bacterium]MBD3773077.1 hypothetical protein [Paracoccaceae bacterium]